MSEHLLPTQSIDWPSLHCRFDRCSGDVVGIYHVPEGCLCWTDPVQALCGQHIITAESTGPITTIVERSTQSTPSQGGEARPLTTEEQELTERALLHSSTPMGLIGDSTPALLAQVLATEKPAPGAEAIAEKDEAYRQRNVLVAALSHLFPSGIRPTNIEGWSPDWHGCVYIDLPTGQISYHYHDSHAWLFEYLPWYQKEWDGHDKDKVHERLLALRSPAIPAPSTEIIAQLKAELNGSKLLHQDAVDHALKLEDELAALRHPLPAPAQEITETRLQRAASILRELADTNVTFEYQAQKVFEADAPAQGVAVTDEMVERARLKILPFISHLASDVQTRAVRAALQDALHPAEKERGVNIIIAPEAVAKGIVNNWYDECASPEDDEPPQFDWSKLISRIAAALEAALHPAREGIMTKEECDKESKENRDLAARAYQEWVNKK